VGRSSSGEIAQLHADHLCLEGDAPHVRIIESKGRHEDVIPLSGWLVGQLDRCKLPQSGWILPSRFDPTRHRDRHSISGSAGRHLHSLGLQGGIHTLRHRFGTQTYLMTRDLRVTQELMRHSDPSTTALYTSLAPGELAEAVNLLPPL
jgi:integrase